MFKASTKNWFKQLANNICKATKRIQSWVGNRPKKLFKKNLTTSKMAGVALVYQAIYTVKKKKCSVKPCLYRQDKSPGGSVE